MRTVYLGTSAFAAGVLRALATSAYRPVLVVSRPDRPRGRGRRMQSPPVVELARELEMPVEQPDSVNAEQARARITAAEPQRLIVCAFGALIAEPLLSEHGPILNVHPSLLPRWRGAAPIERAILAGDPETGVSIMQLTAGLDSGPICLSERLPIAGDDDYGALAARLQTVGAELLLRALDVEASGGAAGLRCDPQDDSAATYADKLTPEDRLLDPARPAAELARRVRALSPHIGARLQLDEGAVLGVWNARPLGDPGGTVRGEEVPAHDDFPDLPAAHWKVGKIVETGGLPALACADGLLVLDVVQPAGRKRMSGADWVRGLRP